MVSKLSVLFVFAILFGCYDGKRCEAVYEWSKKYSTIKVLSIFNAKYHVQAVISVTQDMTIGQINDTILVYMPVQMKVGDTLVVRNEEIQTWAKRAETTWGRQY